MSSPPRPVENLTGKPQASRKRVRAPTDYVWPVRWLIPILIVATALLLALLIAVARISEVSYAVAAISGALLGLAMTLVGTAWGSAIVFADSPRRGLWFTIFPPYMVVYTVQHWNWMRQPAVLFLCGLCLAFGILFGPRWLATAADADNPAAERIETIHERPRDG